MEDKKLIIETVGDNDRLKKIEEDKKKPTKEKLEKDGKTLLTEG